MSVTSVVLYEEHRLDINDNRCDPFTLKININYIVEMMIKKYNSSVKYAGDIYIACNVAGIIYLLFNSFN